MGIFMLTWVDFAYLARLIGQNDLHLSKLCLKIAWVATPPLFYTTYLISIYFIKGETNHKKQTAILLLLTIFSGLLTAFSSLIISDVAFQGIGLDIVYGKAFYPFLVFIATLMFFTVVPLFKKTPNKKASIFLAGVFIFYIANMIFNITLPAFLGITHLYYFGDYSTIFLLGFTAFAIIKHKLFDIKILTTEILTIILWSILFSKIFITTTLQEFSIDLTVFVLSIVFGILLIQSVIKEAKIKQELEFLNQRLQILDKRKNEFISVAAHELRTPLTAVKGYISMIIEGDAGTISSQAQEFLEDVTVSTNRMIRLVNNLLDVSRIEENRITYAEDFTNLIEIAQSAFSEFKLEAKRKGLQFTLDVSPNLSSSVFVDKDRLHEVVVNLLSNAFKYTKEGSVKINLSNPTPRFVRLEVIDTGPGISSEEQKKLFAKFYRVKSHIGKTVGSGLGLYISKLLITKFGGQIGLVSVPSKGSNFYFDLPIKQKA
jgi:signal transduction histidine kinase